MKAIGLILLGALLALPGLGGLVGDVGGGFAKAVCIALLVVGSVVLLYGLVLNHRDHVR
jgi:hypothetical protein